MITALHCSLGTDLPVVRFDSEHAILLVDGAEQVVRLNDPLDFVADFEDLDKLERLTDMRMRHRARFQP